MSILKNIFKKEDEAQEPAKKPAKKAVEKKPKAIAEKPVVTPTTVTGEKPKNVQRMFGVVKPLVTEKSAHISVLNKYAFAVAKNMNKIEIRKAIKDIYKVDPIDVHIVNVSGKKVRYGRNFGKTRDWKKAYVTLKAGDKIEIYEGV